MGLFDVITPRVCELGRLKIGGLGDSRTSKSGGTYRLPVKFDHFVIVGMNRTGAGDLQRDDALMQSLADEGYADADGKLRQLPIAVLSNEITDVMQAAYVCYVGKMCAARSDGLTLTKFANVTNTKGSDGKFRLEAVPLPEPEESPWKPEMASSGMFKVHTTFNCVIAGKKAHWGGVYKFRTTSRITASQLSGSLIALKELMGGVLRGMPLRLVVRPMLVNPGGKPITVYVVHCEALGDDLMHLQQMAMERCRFELENRKALDASQAEYRRLLSGPGEYETVVEAAEVQQEFAPESEEEAAPEGDALFDSLLTPTPNGEPVEVAS